ncbi:hypothetical protein [Morganella psychrotolerans]|uniref:Uncharacterized protein n=1 Tax=Morganella psychrotolerans TaxID=368603 RepID=A0A1B8HMT8_9GAMM|nr:hypothetical protein [Morganella psychrotolerans]OBU10763.1 hypothetical protein AYY17_14680 [Morganella psychrotolerans]
MNKNSPLKMPDLLLEFGKPNFIGRDFLLQYPTMDRKVDSFLTDTLCDLRLFYPEFNSWVSNVVIPGIIAGERSIILEYRQDDLAGLAILKDSNVEKKTLLSASNA